MKPAHAVLTVLLRRRDGGLRARLGAPERDRPHHGDRAVIRVPPADVDGGDSAHVATSSPGLNDDAVVTVNVFRKNPNVARPPARSSTSTWSATRCGYFRTDGRNAGGRGRALPHHGPAQ